MAHRAVYQAGSKMCMTFQILLILTGLGMFALYGAGYFGRTNMVLTGGIIGAIIAVLTLVFFEAWVSSNMRGDTLEMGWGWITGLVLGYVVGGLAGMIFGVWAIERQAKVMRLESGVNHSFGGVLGGVYGMFALSELWSGTFAIASSDLSASLPLVKLLPILGVIYPVGLPILGAYVGYLVFNRASLIY